MKNAENYLDPEQRAALERRVFEAGRDLLYFEGKAKYTAAHGDDAVPDAVERDAFNRRMEKDWPAEQRDMRGLSDARLADRLADVVERLDALGLRQRAAGEQPPPAPDDDPWDLSRVKPVTKSLIEAIFLDAEPTPAALNDFGIASPAHFQALALPVRDDQITFVELDAAYGNGPVLTALVNAAPSNPHKGITFETPWDWVLGRTGRTGAPVQQAVRRMLDDVEAVTRSRFYEDPNPVAGPVEMFRAGEGTPVGEPFAALSAREQVQVRGDYTDWQSHKGHGITDEQLDRVFANVIEGKPRGKWLDGTGLTEPQQQQQPARTRVRQIEPGE